MSLFVSVREIPDKREVTTRILPYQCLGFVEEAGVGGIMKLGRNIASNVMSCINLSLVGEFHPSRTLWHKRAFLKGQVIYQTVSTK